MSNGRSQRKGFRPEVRTSYREPCEINGQIVDSVWREIRFEKAQFGVPDGYFDAMLSRHGLLGLAQAEAIRWWFLSIAERQRALGSLCLETRLQEYSVVETYEVSKQAAIAALDCRGRAIGLNNSIPSEEAAE